ncbi:hypothetical protein PH210_19705 [Paenibacillus sp. BSR1-1]|uniref:hypothetical protein n=1 Tax=Paenibacillus sp. BSR1-1 TaxID=3020845 RepID=UPI0025AFCA27|nr:hypothetical protein [Paenibacillus sp. BSR1-1]MDN3018410.1 hypothetical protein [Paenibacillus sp. BSR1-1]
MWKAVVDYLPDWEVFIQAFITFLIPFTISRLFRWISSSKERYVIETTEDRDKAVPATTTTDQSN